jgi:hypothetical protein
LILAFTASPAFAQQGEGVAIQKVINNTRSELGQLASSSKAREIADLMDKFDTQYTTWSNSCAQQSYNPDDASDACKNMADQMRETGTSLYAKLSDYLPDVAARYEQGAQSAQRIVQATAMGKTPAELYEQTQKGVGPAGAAVPGVAAGEEGPFALAMEDFPDQTDEFFTKIQKLVPDFGHEFPEAVRAGNAQIHMAQKAKKARYLAARFQKVKFAMEAQRDYEKIIINTTKAVEALPSVLGIQYTGSRLSAKPNRKVLEHYREPKEANPADAADSPKAGGFKRRS